MDTSLRSTPNSAVNIAHSKPAVVTAVGKPDPQSGNVLPPRAVASGESAGATLRKQQIEKSEKAAPVDAEQTREAVRKINEALREKNRELEFSVDDGSGRTVVKVIHSESGEVIRQLPPEVVLKFANAFSEGSASLLEEFA